MFVLNAQQDTTKSWKDYMQLRGYVKDMQTFSFVGNLDNAINDNLIHNRINLRVYPTKNITAGLEFRNRLFWGETVKLTLNYGAYYDEDPGLVDMSWLLVDENSVSLLTQVDRTWVNWNNDKWEVRVGRQRINWGITTFWNSNDLFNAYSFTDFDYEERPGVDAIKVQRYLKGMSSIEAAVKPGKDSSDWVGAVMYRFNKWQYDVQVLGGWYNTDVAVGLGWAGNLKTASFKGEATYFHPQDNIADTSGSVSISTSIDYVFKQNTYTSVGYLFNSGGINESINFNNIHLLGLPVSAKSLMPAMHSVLANASFPITPLFNITLVGVYSPTINSMLAMPSLGYSISNTWQVAVFAQSYWLGEDFTNLGNGIYLRFKWSF